MAQATELLQLIADEAGVKVCTQPCELTVAVDGDRMVQVLTNLLRNAIKFSPPQSTVWLTVERIDSGNLGMRQNELKKYPSHTANWTQHSASVLITVRDQGRGIPPDKLEIIFDRFQQVGEFAGIGRC